MHVVSYVHLLGLLCRTWTVKNYFLKFEKSLYCFEILFNQTLIKSLMGRKFCHSTKCLIFYHFVLCTWCCFTNHFRRLYIYIYIYIRLKIKPNSVRIRSQSCQTLVPPSTGPEPTPLLHCSTIRLALRPAPQTTRLHPLPKKGASIILVLPFLVR